MESKLYEVTKEHYEQRVLWVILSFFGNKTLKRINISVPLYMGKQNNINKNVYFEYFSQC